MTDFTVTIGGKEYPAKRVNIATLKRHRDFLKQSARSLKNGGVSDEDGIDGIFEMTDIVHACIKRANPNVTLEEIEEALDQDELVPAFNKVMTGSGFAAAGEPKPASSQT